MSAFHGVQQQVYPLALYEIPGQQWLGVGDEGFCCERYSSNHVSGASNPSWVLCPFLVALPRHPDVYKVNNWCGI
jgi:hypothetical protein